MIRAWSYLGGKPGHQDVAPDEISAEIDPSRAVVWVDCMDPTDADLATIREQTGVGSMLVEAIANPRERTKLVRYDDAFHVAVHDCALVDGRLVAREVDIVMGPGWLLTVRHSVGGEPFDSGEVMRRFELQRTVHSRSEEGFLLWALVDLVVDRYFDVCDAVDVLLDDVEDDVFQDERTNAGAGSDAIPRGVFALRRSLVDFRRAAAPLREVVDGITRKELPFCSDEALVLFHDVYDRLLRVLDLVETQRDLLTGLLEADLAVVSNRLATISNQTNDVMKKVTSWGAILVSATLIAGIYGMNFRDMPELKWSFGYPAALLSMVAVMGGLYWMFKRKHWL